MIYHCVISIVDGGRSVVQARKQILFDVAYMNFYPRSPHGERLFVQNDYVLFSKFLSTLSAWRATPKLSGMPPSATNFYPRSPHGERPDGCELNDETIKFLSTLSAWRATYSSNNTFSRIIEISIHALRMESDLLLGQLWSRMPNFYPRSPHGERP